LGRIGWCHHAQIILAHPGFKLVAVCDLEPDRIQEAQAASGCAGYPRLSGLLKDENVELVVVATQSKDHEPMSLRALQAGKHVLVEKPAARTAAGIDRMIAASKKAGRVLTMHHNYRNHPETLFLREIIESKMLGRVFRIQRRQAGFGRRNDWQTLRKYGGSMLGNWCVHLVDQGLQLMNSPVDFVWGQVQQVFNPGDAEDDIKAVVRTQNGMVLDIDMTSVDASEQPKWVLCGSLGTLWTTGDIAHVKVLDPKRLKPLKVNDLHLAPGRQYGVVPGPDTLPWVEKTLEVKPEKTVESFYDNLYKAIRNGKKLIVEPESARATYDVLDRIRKGSGF
jgi:predicted dehydrogenase